MFDDNHIEFLAHSLALVCRYVHLGRGSLVQNVSEVEDIHEYIR